MIDGDRTLPTGFAHPHASEEARAVAEAGEVFRVPLASGGRGAGVNGQDDREQMGVCLVPARFVTGLARVPRGIDATDAEVEFEQYQRHTVWDQPGGLANRSGAGDLDVVVYSARKWCRLALAGNPTVLLALFVPDEEVVYRNDVGAELVDNAHRFVSRLAAARFLGYLQSQRASMTGEVGAHTNRPELVAEHGYDTKFAMHALRLGIQGVELLTSGRITLPVPEPERGYLRRVRHGDVGLDEVIARVAEAEARLTSLKDAPTVPPQPDRAWVDHWLHRSHLAFWNENNQKSGFCRS